MRMPELMEVKPVEIGMRVRGLVHPLAPLPQELRRVVRPTETVAEDQLLTAREVGCNRPEQIPLRPQRVR